MEFYRESGTVGLFSPKKGSYLFDLITNDIETEVHVPHIEHCGKIYVLQDLPMEMLREHQIKYADVFPIGSLLSHGTKQKLRTHGAAPIYAWQTLKGNARVYNEDGILAIEETPHGIFVGSKEIMATTRCSRYAYVRNTGHCYSDGEPCYTGDIVEYIGIKYTACMNSPEDKCCFLPLEHVHSASVLDMAEKIGRVKFKSHCGLRKTAVPYKENKEWLG